VLEVTMFRFSLAACLFVVGTGAALLAAPVPSTPADSSKDREGNPLPRGATARLGSLAFRGSATDGLGFSRDGKQLRAPSDDGRVLSWDAATGRALAPAVFKPELDRTFWSGAVAGDRAVWFESAGRVGAETRYLAVVYGLADAKEISRFVFAGLYPVALSALPHKTGSASLTPDGKYFATVASDRKSIEVYALDTGKLLCTVESALGIDRVCASADSKTLYFLEGGSLRRCELATGRRLTGLAGADEKINLMEASPDGKWLVSRSEVEQKDEQGRVDAIVDNDYLVVRDTVADKGARRLEPGGRPLHFRFVGPDALVVLALKDRSPFPQAYVLSRWKLTTLAREWEVPGPLLPRAYHWLAASPDGKRFAVTDRQCMALLYDAATGKPVAESTGHATAVAWVGFTPGGEQILTAAQDGVRTWTPKGELKSVDVPPEFARGRIDRALLGDQLVWVGYTETGKKAQLVAWDRARGAIGWGMVLDGAAPDRVLSADGKRCVAFEWNNAQKARDVTVYDGPAGKVLHSWQLPATGRIAWPPMVLSPTGDVLFVAADGITGFEVATGNKTVQIAAGQFPPETNPAPFPMAISADGTRLAVVTQSKRTHTQGLVVFEIKSGKKLAEHTLERLYLPGLRLSPNGKQVAVWNSWSPTVLVYDAESSLVEPRKLEGGTVRATSVAFNPNGASLAVGYQDGTALLWDLTAK
jgi:WD40 repeat protein